MKKKQQIQDRITSFKKQVEIFEASAILINGEAYKINQTNIDIVKSKINLLRWVLN